MYDNVPVWFRDHVPSEGFTDEQYADLRILLQSRAWLEVYIPMLLAARDQSIQLMIEPTEDRKRECSDDFLRGRIKSLDSLLLLGSGLVDQHNYDMQKRADDEHEEEVNEALAYPDEYQLS